MRIALTVLFLVAVATACKTYSNFTSPNNIVNEDCQVFLTNGKEMDGKLTVQFETGQYSDKTIKIKTDAKTVTQVSVADIKYYKYRNDSFYPKQINLETYDLPARDKVYTPNVSNILFLKRLTKENDKLQLFELFKPGRNTADGNDQYDYYISFPNESRFAAWSTRGTKFFPRFEEKMSQIVSECPSLAKKVADKENGYNVKQVSIDAKKNDVVKKIIEEYNSCH